MRRAFPFGRSLGIVGHPTFRMKLEAKLKTALDENRLLILGAQVVFGFQFDGIFRISSTPCRRGRARWPAPG